MRIKALGFSKLVLELSFLIAYHLPDVDVDLQTPFHLPSKSRAKALTEAQPV